MNKILLINPPWNRLFGESALIFPLGLSYIAGVLEEHGFDVSVYNADFVAGRGRPLGRWYRSRATKYNDYLHILNDINHPLWQEIEAVISQQSPDIVGISVTTPKYGSALNVGKLVKKIDPDIPVVFGGVHPTTLPEETLKNKEVDIVVRGEGEYTFLDLVENVDKLHNVPGISYKERGKIIHNIDRPLIQNLDELPFPAKHLWLEKDKYSPESFGEISASRGCPYKCIFCASHLLWTRKVRYRSPENVVNEIKHTQETFGTYLFRFADDSFNLNKKFVEDFCNLLIEEKVDIAWKCGVRAELIYDDLIKKMKSAGCKMVLMGIESGNNDTLKKIKKGITIEQVKNADKVLKANKMRSVHYFMLFPWETKEEIDNTISVIKELYADTTVISVAVPFPGTELYDMCKSEGRLPREIDWATFFPQSPDMLSLNKNFTTEEFLQLIKEVERVVGGYNKKKRRKSLLSDSAYFIKVAMRAKYKPRDLWALFRSYFWE